MLGRHSFTGGRRCLGTLHSGDSIHLKVRSLDQYCRVLVQLMSNGERAHQQCTLHMFDWLLLIGIQISSFREDETPQLGNRLHPAITKYTSVHPSVRSDACTDQIAESMAILSW